MLGADTSDAVDVGAYYFQSSAPSNSYWARCTSADTTGASDLAVSLGSTAANTWSIQSAKLDTSATKTVFQRRRAADYLDGTDTSANTLRPITSPVIGCGWYTNSRADFFDGDIAEILIYDSVLTPEEFTQVEYYLWRRWGFGAATPNYLQSNFVDPGSNEDLRVMESSDGATWYLRPSYYNPTTGHVVRDPSIFVYDGTYWCLHTNITGVSNSSTGFDVASSDDGVVFTFVATYDFAGDISGINRCWAPEAFYDSPNDMARIYFSVSTDGGTSFVIYETHPTNAGWTTNSAPVAVTGTGLPNRIDGNVVYSTGTANGPYFMWFKNETTKYIEIMASASPTSGYTMLRTGDWMGIGSGIEGPSILQASGVWRVYVDRYLAGTGIAYTDQATGDWRSGSTTWGALTGITAPFTTRHGTVIALTIPVNTVAPAVTPTSGNTGDTFTSTTGTWTNSPTGYSYQWKLDGANVGTDSNTYVPVSAGSLTCVVTASNAGGDSDPEESNAATVSQTATEAAATSRGLSGTSGLRSQLSGL